MRFSSCLVALGLVLCVRLAVAQDPFARLHTAVERSTLAQVGTRPFHLKATLAPSYVRAGDAERTGEVELWWLTPTHYRRELRCGSFHQVEIVDGVKVWQHNDGDYLPDWLRVIAEKLIEPVSPAELAHARAAEVRHLLGTTYFQWTNLSSDGTVQKGMGASIDLNDATGLLRLDSDGKENYQDFHGRTIARIVTDGSPEVRATVTTLEDLPATPESFLNASQPGADPHPIRTVQLDEVTVRRNLQASPPPVWPPLRDGPLEGILTTDLILDRAGHPRDCPTPISDNPGVNDTARSYICGLKFSPILLNGEPVQVVSRLTMPFKTTRPAGAESFDSARNYFERGRKGGFPATGAVPYLLRAEFQTKGASGALESGRYEDTFQDEQHWRREAWFGTSHAVRSRNGDKRYRLEEGPQAGLARLVLRITEPIPAIDTFVESDWRMNTVSENGSPTVRVLSGYESPEGKLDPQHSRAYWFTPAGQLVKTYSGGLETRRSDFQEFEGIQVARTVGLYSNGGLALKLTVTELSTSPPSAPKQFEVKGHEWTRQFTDEVR
jgi:hypothetical protein